ncbi:MAG: flagellar hook protein FlgE [Mycobacterium leprae]
MRSLFAAVTGLHSHQVRMDVIGNNIANVNTTGFKGSRVTFGDVLSQTMNPGSEYSNPQQVGLGVGVASTDLLMDDGSLQMTGRSLDLAIEGNGMFVLKQTNGNQVYSRAGNFTWSSDGHLQVAGSGERVQGWMADAAGNIPNTDEANMSDIQMLTGSVALARPTTMSTLAGNLDAGAAVGDTVNMSVTVYDSLGRAQSVPIKFVKAANPDATHTQWNWTYLDTANGAAPGTWEPAAPGNALVFDTTGKQVLTGTPSSTANPKLDITYPGASNLQVAMDMTAISQGYNAAGGSDVMQRSYDGTMMGTLQTVSIDDTGTVTGTFSNGDRRTLAKVALALFSNTSGLLKAGMNSFAASSASGAPQIGTTNSGGRGKLLPGNLEMSNVDLATEFTNMILTQRGFQANTRIISTADQMLDDVVNLKR